MNLRKREREKEGVRWEGLIRSFRVEDMGEFKVVRKAEGKAPWGGRIEVEVHETEIDYSIIVSLPEQGGRILALLDANDWEIWITPRNEIHVVRPNRKLPNGYPPTEYLMLTE